MQIQGKSQPGQRWVNTNTIIIGVHKFDRIRIQSNEILFVFLQPNTKTNNIQFWKITRIRILFGFEKSPKYLYEYHFLVSTIWILFEYRIICSPLSQDTCTIQTESVADGWKTWMPFWIWSSNLFIRWFNPVLFGRDVWCLMCHEGVKINAAGQKTSISFWTWSSNLSLRWFNPVLVGRAGKKWWPHKWFPTNTRCGANVNPFIFQCHPDGHPKHG